MGKKVVVAVALSAGAVVAVAVAWQRRVLPLEAQKGIDRAVHEAAVRVAAVTDASKSAYQSVVHSVSAALGSGKRSAGAAGATTTTPTGTSAAARGSAGSSGSASASTHASTGAQQAHGGIGKKALEQSNLPSSVLQPQSSGTSAIRPVVRVEKRGFTKEDLAKYDGENERPVYISVKRVVYDVDPHFYGPGQDYHVFAGKEISRCLAKSQVSDVEANRYWVPGSSQEELDILEGWSKKMSSKYPVVGWYVPDDEYFEVKPKDRSNTL